MQMPLKELFSSEDELSYEAVVEAASAEPTLARSINGWRQRLRAMPFSQACGEVQFFLGRSELDLNEFERLRELTGLLRRPAGVT